jgi:hypothetical protein
MIFPVSPLTIADTVILKVILSGLRLHFITIVNRLTK